MERDVSFLRCSKLSSYVEFNKMIHGLQQSIHGYNRGELLHTTSTRKGTCTEYNFYQTLTIMLNQVLNNPHVEIQHQELLTIYQWFCLNRPYTLQKVNKTSVPKPQLFLTKSRTQRGGGAASRPQTAPAALGYTTPTSSCKTPLYPPSTPAPLLGFTSNYVTHSLHTSQRPPTHSPSPSDLGQTEKRRPVLSRSEKRDSSTHSTIDNIEHRHSRILTPSTIYLTASSIAADMTLNRMTSSLRTPLLLPYKLMEQYKPPIQATPQYINADRNEVVTLRDNKKNAKKNEVTLETITEGTEELNMTEITKAVAMETMIKSSVTTENPPPLQKDTQVQSTASDHTRSEVDMIAVPVVSIRDKRTLSTDKLVDRCTPKHSRRQPHQMGVVSLSFPNDQLPLHRQTRQRSPKTLMPMIAGFNKHHYRPKTVA